MCLKNVFDYLAQKAEIKRNHRNALELLRVQQDFERKNILAAQMVAQKEKKINTIKSYTDIVPNILHGKYEVDKFNSIADDVLTCLDEDLDAELIFEIEALNEKIKEYFERIRRNDSWANVTLGQVKDLFEALKPKLLALIRDQKSTIEHAPEVLYAAHGGEKVEKSNMSDEKIKKLKKKVKSRAKK